MRLAPALAVVAVVALAAAATWFALHDAPSPAPTGEGVAGSAVGTAGQAPGAPGQPIRAAPARAWRARGEGVVIGRLRDPRGERPLADVLVELSAGPDGPARTLSSTTGPDGAFVFERVPDWEGWTFRARPAAPAVEVEQGGIAVLPRRTTDLGVLYAAAPMAVSGIVIDLDGAPVAAADVRVVRRFAMDLSSGITSLVDSVLRDPVPLDGGTTGADGRFRLEKTPPGSFEVRAEHAGFARGVARVELVPGAEGPDVRIVLVAGHVLEGRVARKDGEPVAGARVRVLPDVTRSTAPWEAFTRLSGAACDSTGAFRVTGLAAGEWDAIAFAEGFVSASAKRVRVPTEAALTIEIGGDASLAGTVTGPDGTPLAGARVLVMQGEGLGDVTTGDDGAYRVEGLDSGTEAQVHVAARGFVPHGPWGFHPGPDGSGLSIVPGENRHDVRLSAGGGVRGRVVEKGTENGISGVRVRISLGTTLGSRSQSPAEGFTDTGGRFELRGLGEGPCRLSLERSGWHAVGAEPADEDRFAALRILEGRGDDRGAWGEDAGAGLDLVVTDDSLLERTLEMERAAVLAGRVVDPAGAPVAGALVAVRVEKSHSRGLEIETLFGDLFGRRDDGSVSTDGEGRFEVTAPPGVDVRLSVRAARFVDATSDVLQGASGARRDGVEIRLLRGATIEGLVMDSDGSPVADAEVRWAKQMDGPAAMFAALGLRTRPAVRTDGDGRYRIDGVASGQVDLAVSHPRFVEASRKGLAAEDGAALTADITLDRGATIAGRVIDQAGAPVAEAKVHAQSASEEDSPLAALFGGTATSKTAETGADGSFRIEGLRPDEFRVTAEAEGLLAGEPVLAIADGPPVTLRVSRALSIRGIVRCGGRPVGAATVGAIRAGESPDPEAEFYAWDDLEWAAEDPDMASALTETDGLCGAARVGADGSFEISGLASGKHVLVVRGDAAAPGGNVLPARLRGVDAGATGVVVECREGQVLAGVALLPDGSVAQSGDVDAVPLFDDEPSIEEAEEESEYDAFGDTTGSASIRDGRFRVHGLAPGRYRVTVRTGDGHGASVVAEAGATDVRVPLAKLASVAGRLLSAAGTGAPDVGLQLEPAHGDLDALLSGWVHADFATSDAAGRFRFEGVPAGRWRVWAFAQSGGRCWTAAATVTVRGGEAATVPDLVLADAGPAQEPDGPDEMNEDDDE